MSDRLVFLTMLVIPLVWFGWIGFIYMATSDIPFISDVLLFIIGLMLCIFFAVVTILELKDSSKLDDE